MDPDCGLSCVAERVHVTLPPGGANGLGGALVRLRCGVSARSGTLRVVGVRWKLSGKVWGAMAFMRPGVCLRRTREERASSARAPDASLAVHIVGDMPRVVARFRDLSEDNTFEAWSSPGALPRSSSFSTLDGEVRRGTLELANVGRAAASDIIIRCNLPWVAIGGELKTESEKRNISVRHSALGATGLSWRAVDVHCSQMILKLGESASLPIFFRAHGHGGKEQMQILIQYSPSEKKLDLEPPRGWPPFKKSDFEAEGATCWAPMVCDQHATDAPPLSQHALLCIDVTILPSFSLDAVKAIPKFNRPTVHHLSLTLTNCRADEDTSVTPRQKLRLTRVYAIGDGTWQLHDSFNCYDMTKTVYEGASEKARQQTADHFLPSHKVLNSQAPVDVVGCQEQLALHYTVGGSRNSSPMQCTDSDIILILLKVEQATMRFEDELERVLLRPDSTHTSWSTIGHPFFNSQALTPCSTHQGCKHNSKIDSVDSERSVLKTSNKHTVYKSGWRL